MTREEWLKTLKAGDQVASRDANYYSKEIRYDFYTIKRITNTGKIRLTNEILLDENGHYHKYSHHSTKKINIEPITDEILAHEAYRKEYNSLHNEVYHLCERFNRATFTIEQLKELKALLAQGFTDESKQG